VEIREQYPLNCGRDNFPRYFKRGKLAKTKTAEVIGPMDPSIPSDYWKIEDLYIGLRANMLSSDFLIYDADPFTREYVRNHLGIELAERIDVKLPEREVPRPTTPPYNGYGSWDDSMASVLNLVPKVPRRDFHKLMYNDKKKLGFTAMFANPREEDVNRRFVFTYCLWDDQMSVQEPPQRNSGQVGGRFLEKAVHLNQKTGRLIVPEDLLPGNIVQIMNHEFRMLDMDEGTRRILEAQQEGTGHASLSIEALRPVLEKLRESLRQQFPLMRDVFRRFDKDRNGVITIEEMKEALQKFSFQLSDSDVAILMRHFDTHKDGQISYNEFCDAVLERDVMDSTAVEPQLKTSLADGYMDRAQVKSIMRGETEKVRRAATEISAVVYQNPGMQMKLIKEFASMTHQKEITVEMVHAALLRLGHHFDLEDVERACGFFLGPGADFGRIPYFHLVQQINSSYHDLCCTR